MSKGFNYSKWDNIEISDDEDDVHPNIDKESWFRMKHRSRVEREDREEEDKKSSVDGFGEGDVLKRKTGERITTKRVINCGAKLQRRWHWGAEVKNMIVHRP